MRVAARRLSARFLPLCIDYPPGLRHISAMDTAKPLFSYRKHWAAKFGTAPFLPMSRDEMDLLGWDSCDIVLVTGDAYIDHPSFGMAVIGRLLEAQGFRVGIISQPDWQPPGALSALGRPTLFYGVTGGNMDSVVNRYTADKKIRRNDSYTPGGEGGKRPDRSVVVYAQRCREAYRDVPLVIGSIEASLRRIAHYDYWSDKVRRSILLDSRADLLLYGNAERAVIEIAHRLARREPIERMTDVRGTAFVRRRDDPSAAGWMEIDSTEVDRPGRIDEHINPYLMPEEAAAEQGASCAKAEGAAAPAGGAQGAGLAAGGGGQGLCVCVCVCGGGGVCVCVGGHPPRGTHSTSCSTTIDGCGHGRSVGVWAGRPDEPAAQRQRGCHARHLIVASHRRPTPPRPTDRRSPRPSRPGRVPWRFPARGRRPSSSRRGSPRRRGRSS